MEFTKKQIKLLARHLTFYEGLHAGTVPANTPEREHFLEVIRGEVEPATPHEEAYLKYLKGNKTRIERMIMHEKLGIENERNPNFSDEIF